MQSVAKASLRIGRNALGGYSDNANRARDATSSDIHPPSHSQLVELSESTFIDNDRADIIGIIDKRLGAKGKLWPQVFKGLIVVNFCLLNGSTRFVRHYQQEIHLIKTLREFQHIDEAGTDQGANIRERARTITVLLENEERLLHERKHGEGSWDPSRHAPPKASSPVRTRPAASPARKAQPPPRSTQQDEDREFQEALRISREEEERRQRDLKAQGDEGLFDDMTKKDNDLLDFSAPSQPAFDPYAAQQAQQQAEWARQQQMMAMQAQADAQAQWMQQQAYMQQQAEQQAYYQWQAQQAYVQQQAQLAQQHTQAYQHPQPTGNPFSAFAPSPQPPPPEPTTPQPAPAPVQNSLTAHQAQQPQRTGRHAELEGLLAAGGGVDTFGNYGDLRFGAGQRR